MPCTPTTPCEVTHLPAFNVKTCGAAGDGEADDTQCIQNAVNAAQAAGGGMVFFPPGTYLHHRTVTFPSNVTLLGVRGASLLKLADGAAAPGVHMYQNVDTSRGNSDVSFSGLTFDGNRAGNPAGSAHGLFAVGVERLIVEQCSFRRFPSRPDAPGGERGDGIFIRDANAPSRDVIIRDSWFYDNGRNGIAITNARRVVVANVIGYGNTHALIDIEPDDADDVVENVLVTGCFSDGGGRYGFVINNATGVALTDARLVACSARGHGIAGFAIDRKVTRARVLDCIAFNNGGDERVSPADWAGLTITDSADCTVLGGEYSSLEGSTVQRHGVAERGSSDRNLVASVRGQGPSQTDEFTKVGDESVFRNNVSRTWRSR